MKLENRVRNAFDCIGASEGLKASTKAFLREAGEKARRSAMAARPAQRHLRLTIGTAVAAMTIFLCVGSYALLWMPVSFVSVDVNPSLELALNRLDRVIYVQAYNEDGEKIAESVSVKGMGYEDAINRMLGSEAMEPYLAEGSDLTFTIAADSGRREALLLAGVANSSGCMEHGGISVRADMELVGEAHGNGLSLGKYMAYQLLRQYDPTVTVQDCHGMSMSQIHGLIEEHEHGSGHSGGSHTPNHETEYEMEEECSQQIDTEGSGTGHGHGHGSGHGH